MMKMLIIIIIIMQVTLYHLLKLFHADAHLQPQQQTPRKELVSEFYDEIVSTLTNESYQLLSKILVH